MARHALTPVHIAARVTAGIFGAYAFTWGFAAAGVAALTGLGVAYHDAEMGVLMLAFLVFLGLFLWSFAAVSIARVQRLGERVQTRRDVVPILQRALQGRRDAGGADGLAEVARDDDQGAVAPAFLE